MESIWIWARSWGRMIVCLGLVVLVSFTLSYAQPTLSKESIPSNIPSDVREQIEKLHSSDPAQRGYAAIALGNMDKWAVIPAIPDLIGMLGDDTALSLYRVGDSVQSTSPGKIAGDALLKIGAPAVKPLIAVLKYGKAADVLVKIGEPAVEPLITTLKGENAVSRWEAAKALGEIKNARAVEPLIIALKDKEGNVRGKAAWALGKIKDVRAVEPLITALKDEDVYVQKEAARALGEIKDARAVKPLEELVQNDSNSDVRQFAKEALAKLSK